MIKPTDAGPPATAEYAGQVLTTRLDRMLAHAEGVLRGEDTEPVHQMRVWSRRTRAALDVFDACFPGKAFKTLAREVKAVTGALGAARDLDVMIGTLTKQAGSLPRTQRAGIDAFIGRLHEKRRVAQKDVERAIAHLEQCDLRGRLAAILAKEGIAATTDAEAEER